MRILQRPRTVPLTVLLVGEDGPNRDRLRRSLAERGHRPICTDEIRALREIETGDVVVSVAGSRGTEGCLDFVQELRRRGRGEPVVVCGPTPDFEQCRRSMLLSVSDFVPAPVHPESLSRSIEEAARRHGRSRDVGPGTYLLDGSGSRKAVRDLLASLVRRGVGPSQRARIASALATVLGPLEERSLAGAQRFVHVRAKHEPGRLTLHVEDRGPSSVLHDDRRGASLDRLPVGGLARARTLCESVVLHASDGGARVSLGFELHPTLFGEDTLDFTEHDYLTPEAARTILEVVEDEELAGRASIPPALAVTVGRLLSAGSHASAPLELKGA